MAKKDELLTVEETGLPEIETVVENEGSLLENLLLASHYKEDETKTLRIKRGEKIAFSFSIHALSEDDLMQCRKKSTSYQPNPAGKQLPPLEKDFDLSLFRSWKIYTATVAKDQERIWGNKEFMQQTGCLLPVETINLLLSAGEKEAIGNEIDDLSKYGVSLEEYAKN